MIHNAILGFYRRNILFLPGPINLMQIEIHCEFSVYCVYTSCSKDLISAVKTSVLIDFFENGFAIKKCADVREARSFRSWLIESNGRELTIASICTRTVLVQCIINTISLFLCLILIDFQREVMTTCGIPI